MSRFAVELTRVAARDLDRIPSSDRDQLLRAMRALAKDPIGRPPLIKRLKGFPFPLYRLRSGAYRVLYRIDETEVTIMRVIDRKDLARTLRQFR